MQIISAQKVDLKLHGITAECDVYIAHVTINDVDKRATEMVTAIADSSWIYRLNAVSKAAFEATSAKTIIKLTQNIANKIENDKLTEDFGEYLVSDTAQCVMENIFKHTKLPLAELIKPRISGNEGFDFHSECGDSFITFGEAKYSGTKSPYTKALSQIIDFIEQNKDVAELVVLTHLVSEEAATNCAKGFKSYAAAFSINAAKPDMIINNALKSSQMDSLLGHKKLYLIGVEVNDPKLD